MMDGDAPVGQQLSDYAGQVAAINRRIDTYFKDGGPKDPSDKAAYDALKQQRDGIASRAKALTSRAGAAGANGYDFASEVRKASKGITPAVKTDEGVKEGTLGDNHDTVVPNAPEADRGFVQGGQFLDRQQAAAANPGADANKDGALHSEELNASVGLPERKAGMLADYREKFPQYKDIPDDKLADGIFNKYYADKMPRAEFDVKVGLKPATPSAQAPGVEPAPGTRPMEVKDLPAEQQARRGYGQQPDISDEEHEKTFQDAAALKTKLKAEGKVPEQDLEYVALLKKRTEGETAVGNRGAMMGATGIMAAPYVKGAIAAAGKAVPYVKGALKTLTGSAAKEADETAQVALRGARDEVSGKAGAAASTEAQTAQTAEVEATRIKQEAEAQVATIQKKAADKIAALQAKKTEVASVQPRVAAQRAEAATATKPGAPDAALGRKGALTRVQDEAQGIEAKKGAATAAKGEAEKAVGEAETTEGAAKGAADKLDQELASKPGLSKEEFGEKLETAVRETSDRLKKARTKEADYAGTLERAGDVASDGVKALRVDTAPIGARIDAIIDSSVRNPTTRKQLLALKQELSTVVGEEAHDAMTVRQADSLRKTLDEAINTKVYSDSAVSKEALAHLKEVRKMLTKQATDAFPEYKEALGKFSTASRPLEFIEKNSLLRKVVADNPEATEAAVTRSQIVGKLISSANTADRKALQRLMVESPELRNSARLYFTDKLFGGPEGLRSMKSVEQMRKFLVDNKSSLDQLGLTKEFKDIKTARETAQRAVDEAAGAAKQSKEMLKQASKREADIQKELTAKQRLVGKAQGRVSEAETERAKALDAKKAEVAQRGEKAVDRLGKQAVETKDVAEKEAKKVLGAGEKGAAEKLSVKEKAAGAAKTWTNVANDLKTASAKDLPGKAKSQINQLRDDGHITQEMRNRMQARIDDAVAKAAEAKDQAAATKKLRYEVVKIVGYGALISGLGYQGYRGIMTAFGH